MRTCSVDGCVRSVSSGGMCHMHWMRWRRTGSTGGAKLRKTEGMTEVDRFWYWVDKTPTCWLWTNALRPNGYGRFAIGRSSVPAHRYAYELSNGPVPDGLELDHLCGVPACVNPDHLEAVTHAENMRRRLKTHCINGHLLAPPNLYFFRDGSRACRQCQRERSKAYYRRKRGVT